MNSNPLNKLIPPDLVQKIEDMNCIKRSNGKSGRDFMVIIRTNGSAKSHYDNVVEWFSKTLGRSLVDHPSFRNGLEKLYLKFIVENDDCELTDENNNLVETLNQIICVIHIADSDLSIEDYPKLIDFDSGVIFTENYTIVDDDLPVANLSADFIIRCMQNEPGYISGISVSGVKEKNLIQLWYEMLRPISCIFDDSEKGNNVMYRLPIKNRVNHVKLEDNSVLFGKEWYSYKQFIWGIYEERYGPYED